MAYIIWVELIFWPAATYKNRAHKPVRLNKAAGEAREASY
jgi:hypothetical protein